jgi:SAM-dependent methyltransferase
VSGKANTAWEQAFLEVDARRSKVAPYARKLRGFAFGPDELILDLCCGTGLYCGVFRLLGCRRVFGYDLSRNLLSRATSAPVACGDARSLALGSGRFDVVFVAKGMHHFRDLAGLLAEIRRVLRPGGRLIFLEPRNSPLRRLLHRLVFSPLARLSPRVERVRTALEEERDDYFHWLGLSPQALRAEVEAAGFELLRWRDTALHLHAEWRACGRTRQTGSDAVGMDS